MIRHSKQRDAIYDELAARKDHPTAEDLYFSLKPSLPSLSLATVYRNLVQLEADEKIMRIGSGGTARYDADLSDHQHLVCTECGSVTDIMMECGDLCEKADSYFGGKVESCSVIFKGKCAACAGKK